jgi:hypothetical protein
MAKTPQGSYECANVGYGEQNFVFYYVEHAPMDMNLPSQDGTPFTLASKPPSKQK